MEENVELNLIPFQVEENSENELGELEEISTPRKTAYYGLLFTGTLAILNEIPIGKFCFDANSEALDTLHTLFFNDLPLPPIVSVPIKLFPILLNSAADILSIRILHEARAVLNIKKLEDGKLYRIKSTPTENEEIERSFPPLKKGLYLVAFKGVPLIAMALNFSNGAFAGTLPVNQLFNSLVGLKYTLGSLIFAGGVGFSILLSFNDVLKSFNQFKNFSQSPVKLLFSHSKIMAIMPLTRFMVALTNDTSAYYYIAKKVCNEIFQLPQYSSAFGVISISACVIVKTGTLLIPAFKTYLSPFEVTENQYDLQLFDQDAFKNFWHQLSSKEKFQLVLPNLPLSLIRGFGLGFLSYRLIQGGITNYTTLNEELIPIISVSSSFLAGVGFFLHTAYCDVQNALNFKKKTSLLEAQPEEHPEEHCEKGTSFLSFMINLGCQITNGFLSVASIMTLFSPILGEETAATLGIFIALEKGWINFRYFQPKITSQLSELWKYRPSFCSFFKGQPTNNDDIIELHESDSENFSGQSMQNV